MCREYHVETDASFVKDKQEIPPVPCLDLNHRFIIETGPNPNESFPLTDFRHLRFVYSTQNYSITDQTI